MVGQSDEGFEAPSTAEWSAAAALGASLRATDDAARGTGRVPAVARISADLLQRLIDAARDGYPNEACGILAGDRPAADEGRAVAFHGLRNAAESPYRYLIDAEEQLRVMLALDDADQVVWGIFHSHVSSAAEPSVTDIGLAFYPDSLYLICSLGGALPVVRAWSVRGGAVTEVPLQVG